MIVGCDYSTKAIDLAQHPEGRGWQAIKLEVNGIDKVFVDNLTALLEVLVKWKHPTEEAVIYIEQPWSRYNQATAMQMVKVATAVQVLAVQQGYRVEWAHVTAWRSRVFGKGKYPKAVAKRRALEWAREHTGLELEKDDNAADACCIAAYGELREADA